MYLSYYCHQPVKCTSLKFAPMHLTAWSSGYSAGLSLQRSPVQFWGRAQISSLFLSTLFQRCFIVSFWFHCNRDGISTSNELNWSLLCYLLKLPVHVYDVYVWTENADIPFISKTNQPVNAISVLRTSNNIKISKNTILKNWAQLGFEHSTFGLPIQCHTHWASGNWQLFMC